MKNHDLILSDGKSVTISDLRAAFDHVRDPEDWTAPIDALIPVAELEITKEAVQFFTASNLRVVKEIDGEYLVRAVGCRTGVEE